MTFTFLVHPRHNDNGSRYFHLRSYVLLIWNDWQNFDNMTRGLLHHKCILRLGCDFGETFDLVRTTYDDGMRSSDYLMHNCFRVLSCYGDDGDDLVGHGQDHPSNCH